ncbi:hypothetical protein CWE12_02440 [Aliidiomarina sedimenti]|uniref:Uncharacterized protein n=1 Tax=Aliidiomarina sedimenti TaxID=1933879 RepID=A0ABY0C1Z3_9GAMM|nr:hypothetical protein [Aliidiomarina sedimenti]RUO31875.1 hypothetical protein CWE12_02440 [Aliidiomarina sedimenti]
MTGAPQVELAKLHDEFPILNDVQGTLAFRMNEGESQPGTLIWSLDSAVQHHLTRLGITARLQRLLAHLVKNQDGANCEGKIEFQRGRFRVYF